MPRVVHSRARKVYAVEHQHLYNSMRWRLRSAHQLRQHPLCSMCMQSGCVTQARVADHIIPHKGDPTLFYDGELQSLCTHHHNRSKYEIEHRGYLTDIGVDGWPTDPRHPVNRAGKI